MKMKIGNGNVVEHVIAEGETITRIDRNRMIARCKRNDLLARTDLAVISDDPAVDVEKFKTYRQELRDMDFSAVTDMASVSWPTKPE